MGKKGEIMRLAKWMMYVVVIIISLTLSTANVKMQGSRINNSSQDNRSQKVVGVGENKVNQRRIALVIGNGRYPVSSLPNPVNDAIAMEKALTSVGFQVTRLTDLTQREMKAAIANFGNNLRSGGVGLFYYAGHGNQVKGENYLIPIDSQISKESDVDVYGVNVSNILEQMSGARNSLNILILDACRNNPFIASSGRSGKQGLAQISASEGLFIAYATAPGSVANDGTGANSPYTEELVKALSVPGLSIEEVFKFVLRGVKNRTGGKQLPWVSSVLSEDFYFRTGTNSDNTALEREKAVWQGCCVNSNRISDYQSYLQQYPNGLYAAIAKGRIGELERPTNGEGGNDLADNNSSNTNEGRRPNVTESRSSALQLAEMQFKGGDYYKVSRTCEDFLKDNPDHPQGNRLLGMSYFLERRYQQGMPFIVKAVVSGEIVTFTIQHHGNSLFGDTLTRETLVLHRDKFEFQGGNSYSLPYSSLLELNERQSSSQYPYVHMKFKYFDSKERKEKTKDYNFYAPSAELYENKSMKVRCSGCEKWTENMVSIIRGIAQGGLR